MGKIAEMMGGLPMNELVGGPLTAVVSAQRDLAHVMIDYVNEVGLEQNEGGTGNKARVLSFDIDRPVVLNDAITSSKVSIQAPMLGLLPFPSLLVDLVTIDFQMEVTASDSEKTDVGAEVNASISGGFGRHKYSVSGKVTASKENTRSTNQTAKYQVHVEAKQQPQTEVLGKLMDLLASCTEPLKIEQSQQQQAS